MHPGKGSARGQTGGGGLQGWATKEKSLQYIYIYVYIGFGD